MSSAFISWSAFFAMGGYAFYVWLAVAFTLLPLAAIVLHTRWRRRVIFSVVVQRQSRDIRLNIRKEAQ